MRLVLTGRNVEIDPATRNLAERKLAGLERRLRGIGVSAQVVLERERHRHVVEITLHARGDHMLHGLGDARSWEPSLVEAIEKIDQQIQTLKGKWVERRRRGGSVRTVHAGGAPRPGPVVPTAGSGRRVSRAPAYAVKPMTIDEAALAIEDSEDAFLVFRNAQTDEVNVVYRRKRGGLGLIEPER